MIKCNDVAHQNEVMKYKCLKKSCSEDGGLCLLCVETAHSDHIDQCIQIDKLNEYLQREIFNPIEKKLEGKLNSFKEEIIKAFRQVKNHQLNQTSKLFNFDKLLVIELLEKIKEQTQSFQTYIDNVLLQYQVVQKDLLFQLQQINQQIDQLVLINQPFEQNQESDAQQRQLEVEKQLITQKQLVTNEQISTQQSSEVQILITKQQSQDHELQIPFQKEKDDEMQIPFQKYQDDEMEISYQKEREEELEIPHKKWQEKKNLQKTGEKSQHEIKKEKKFNLQVQLFLEDIQKAKNYYQENGIQYTTQKSLMLMQQNPQSLIRISELLRGNIQFFCSSGPNVFASNGQFVQFSDISEGQPEQKYFKSVIIFLANFCPEKLKEIFLIEEFNKQSIYAAKIFYLLQIKYTIIQVDDYVEKHQKILIGRNNSIWITLLWKFIKEVIIIRNAPSVYSKFSFLIFLIPAPLLLIDTNVDNLIKKLEDEIEANGFILVSFNLSDQPELLQILGCVTVKNPFFGDDTLLLKMRSSISKFQYNGDWGFQSPYWTEEIQQQLKIDDMDDGIFYIDFFSFIKEVNQIFSFRFYENILLTQKQIISENIGKYLELTIYEEGDYIFQLFYKNVSYFSLPTQKFLICQILQQQKKSQDQPTSLDVHHKYLDSFSLRFPQSFKLHLKAGSYIIYQKVFFYEEKNTKYKGQMKIYGQNRVELIEIEKIPQLKNQITKSFINQAKQFYFKNGICEIKLERNAINYVIKVTNISNQEFKLKVIFDYSENIKLCKPYQGNQVVKKLKENQSKIIRVKLLTEYFSLPVQFFINDLQIK